jgi:hypothetical protein
MHGYSVIVNITTASESPIRPRPFAGSVVATARGP